MLTPAHDPVSASPLPILLVAVEDVHQVPAVLEAADNQASLRSLIKADLLGKSAFSFFILFPCQKLDTPLNPSYLLR
jgi:hypothetical protein